MKNIPNIQKTKTSPILKGGKTMKKLALIAVIFSMIFTACKTQKQSLSLANDDVYSTSSAQPQPSSTTSAYSTSSAPQVISAPDNSSSVKSGSSVRQEDQNDYSYTAQINRFNNKDTTKGYFDQSFSDGSNSGYVDGGSDPNVNIYLGTGFGGGWGGSCFSMGWGWGWGYPYYYDPFWYSPWYWGYPYYPYYGSYWNGYWNGYWDGYYGYSPYYDYSYGNVYYGPRRMLTSNDGGINNNRNARTDMDQTQQGAIRNDRNVEPGQFTRTDAAKVTARNPVSADKVIPPTNRVQQPGTARTQTSSERYQYSPPKNDRQNNYQRTNTNTRVTAPKEVPAPRYSRPQSGEQIQPARRTTESYSSPAYRQAKSSQEYINPRGQNTTVDNGSNTRSNTRNYGVPATNNNRQASPSGNYRNPGSQNRSNNGNIAPSRNNNTAPTRNNTYSAPSRSSGSGTYTAPSRQSNSSPSYSAPARSGGSGGGSAPSGGGSGGGGRRR